MGSRLDVVALACCVATFAGCGESTAELVVDLRTDFRAGRELDAVLLTLDGSAPRTVPIDAAADWIEGGRLLDYVALPLGPHIVEATLMNAGVEIASAAIAVDLERSQAVTFVVTRACQAVDCDADEYCLGNRCVPSTCTPENVETCPTAQCEADTECSGSAIPCIGGRCLAGVCFEVDNGLCGPGVYCDPDDGCEIGETCGVDVTCCESGSCTESCPAGECLWRCSLGTSCDYDCTGSDCRVDCLDGASCSLTCPPDGCRLDCLGPMTTGELVCGGDVCDQTDCPGGAPPCRLRCRDGVCAPG